MYVYKRNYLSCQGKLCKVQLEKQKDSIPIKRKNIANNDFSELPLIQENRICNFQGYDADILMKEISQLRKLITKRETFEILMPLCFTKKPVRYLTFRNTMKGFSSKNSHNKIKGIRKKWNFK